MKKKIIILCFIRFIGSRAGRNLWRGYYFGINSERWIPWRDISPFGDVKLPQAATWVLYDKSQQVRGQGKSQVSPLALPLEGLPPGVYFLHIAYKEKPRRQQIMAE